jgi:hypothetical protein
VKVWIALGIAAAGLGAARAARISAQDSEAAISVDEPYTPSLDAAPYVSLGYREAAADILFVRLRGYFGAYRNRADRIASLCEAIIALNPRFQRVYEYCGGAMTLATEGVDQAIYLRTIALLERGTKEFPSNWRIPNLAGQIYTQDLKTDDPAKRREWDDKGTRLVESAVRKPGAPAELQAWAAVMQTKMGQHERAVNGLREMILVTNEIRARQALIRRLAEIEHEDANELAGELFEARHRFGVEWLNNRPYIPANWYVLLGPRVQPGFDMADLATGGHDLVVPPIEKLEPIY